MGLAISEEHQALAGVVRSFIKAHKVDDGRPCNARRRPRSVASFWSELTELGWLGLHLPRGTGWSGIRLVRLTIVLEELGRAVAPGPFLPTTTRPPQCHASGAPVSTTTFSPGSRSAHARGTRLHGSLRHGHDGSLQGGAGLVLGGDMADVLVLVVDEDLVVVDRHHDGLHIHECEEPGSFAACRPRRVRLGANTLMMCSPARGVRGAYRARARGCRSRRWSTSVHRDGDGLRQGTCAVRPSDRHLSGSQTSFREHAGCLGTRDGSSVGCGAHHRR